MTGGLAVLVAVAYFGWNGALVWRYSRGGRSERRAVIGVGLATLAVGVLVCVALDRRWRCRRPPPGGGVPRLHLRGVGWARTDDTGADAAPPTPGVPAYSDEEWREASPGWRWDATARSGREVLYMTVEFLGFFPLFVLHLLVEPEGRYRRVPTSELRRRGFASGRAVREETLRRIAESRAAALEARAGAETRARVAPLVERLRALGAATPAARRLVARYDEGAPAAEIDALAEQAAAEYEARPDAADIPDVAFRDSRGEFWRPTPPPRLAR